MLCAWTAAGPLGRSHVRARAGLEPWACGAFSGRGENMKPARQLSGGFWPKGGGVSRWYYRLGASPLRPRLAPPNLIPRPDGQTDIWLNCNSSRSLRARPA